jgi:hypothetical protein
MCVRKAWMVGMFFGFKVGRSRLSMTHLQYANDTFFIGKATIENL